MKVIYETEDEFEAHALAHAFEYANALRAIGERMRSLLKHGRMFGDQQKLAEWVRSMIPEAARE